MSVRVATVNAMTNATYTAAWVPHDDPERSLDDAAEQAVEWVLGEAQRQEAQPLLLTPTKQASTAGPDVIRRFAAKYPTTTPRSSRPDRGRGGPVLAYVPDYDMMQLAATYARNSSLAVVESATHPLVGWAMEVGALNLFTGETTRNAWTESQRADLERIHFYGNNGWTRGFGQDQATQILRDLREEGSLTPEFILGSMVAKGHHGEAIEQLSEIINRVW